MTPEFLLQVLITSANAKTDEEKARVAWRASDTLWQNIGMTCTEEGCSSSIQDIKFARAFNNLLQDKNWPWVKDLWTVEDIKKSIGLD